MLEAFGVNDPQLSLAGLSRRTGIRKTTVLRLARTLAADNYLVQKGDGSWRLGRAAGWLGACYQATFNVQDVVEPVLRELTIKTGKARLSMCAKGDSGPAWCAWKVRRRSGTTCGLGRPCRSTVDRPAG